MPARRKAADHKHPCAKCAVCGLCLSCRLCVCLPKRKAYRPSKAQIEAACIAWTDGFGRPTKDGIVAMRKALIAADRVRREEANEKG